MRSEKGVVRRTSHVACRCLFGGRSVWCSVVALLVVCLVLNGCGDVIRRKFIRKPKARPKPQVMIYSDEGGESQPIETLYENHFLYWKLWQVEAADLLDRTASYGTIVSMKRIRDTVEGALTELRTIRGYLKEEKAVALDAQIAELERVVESLQGDLSLGEGGRLRRQLDQQRRGIERDFAPKEMQSWLRAR